MVNFFDMLLIAMDLIVVGSLVVGSVVSSIVIGLVVVVTKPHAVHVHLAWG